MLCLWLCGILVDSKTKALPNSMFRSVAVGIAGGVSLWGFQQVLRLKQDPGQLQVEIWLETGRQSGKAQMLPNNTLELTTDALNLGG